MKSLKPIIIGVCGGSASGKTFFCQKLSSILDPEDITYISQDNYYKNLDPIPISDRNYDHPHSLDLDLLAFHLSLLKKGRLVRSPVYDFITHRRTDKFQMIYPRPLILVDGLLIFSHRGCLNQFDHTYFIDVPAETRLVRRQKRDIEERGRSLDFSTSQFYKTTLPMHNRFIEPFKYKAHTVLSGEDSFNSVFKKIILDLNIKNTQLPL